MKVKATNGEIVEDGYYPFFFKEFLTYTGFRSYETPIYRQQSLSRLDEKTLEDVLGNTDYYELIQEEGVNYFCYYQCLRCGYIPISKLDMNNKDFLDQHCKCGNPVQIIDFTYEGIHSLIETFTSRHISSY